MSSHRVAPPAAGTMPTRAAEFSSPTLGYWTGMTRE